MMTSSTMNLNGMTRNLMHIAIVLIATMTLTQVGFGSETCDSKVATAAPAKAKSWNLFANWGAKKACNKGCQKGCQKECCEPRPAPCPVPTCCPDDYCRKPLPTGCFGLTNCWYKCVPTAPRCYQNATCRCQGAPGLCVKGSDCTP
ncbi:hypothetical protein SH668x_002385 [Planctomicrobium sp. SH668]|uniref:hypothetical protein n=1 Tax=Planctomicrobium sp. SH668 TaxID=3448126 RepID=UPI003F5C4D24